MKPWLITTVGCGAGVSGHVERPGLFELPLGTPLDEIVFEHAGGVPGGRKLKGVIHHAAVDQGDGCASARQDCRMIELA